MAFDKARVLAAAQKHLGRNNIDRALKELARIVREDPKDLRVRQKVAELLARQGKVTEAMREFAVVAEAYERGGFYPKSAAIYKQMLRFEPDQMRWHLALGEIYQQLALLSDAMDHFNIVAQHFEENGNSKERVDIYEKLIKLNPDSLEYAEKLSELYTKDSDHMACFELWRGLAATLEQRGDGESLVKVYEKMSSLKPEDLALVRSLADIYLDRGDPKRALAKLQVCFKADPQDTETLNLLADAFDDLGEREKAVAVLKELAQIYESLGYEDYRNQVYDRIAGLDPSTGAEFDGDSSLELLGGEEVVAGLGLSEDEQLPEEAARSVAEAEVYLQYGLTDKAQAALEKSTAQHATAYSAHRMLVRLYASSGDLTSAQDRLNTMYELAMDLSDYVAARACLGRALELVPDDAAAAARLEAFEQAMGEFVGDSPAAADSEDAEAFASAIEFSSTLRKGADEEDDDELGFDGTTGDEFDFDDAEMQQLAEELSREMADTTIAATVDEPADNVDDIASLEEASDEESSLALEFQIDDEESLGGEAAAALQAATQDNGADADPLAGLLDGLDLDDDILEGAVERTAFEIGKSYYDTGHFGDAALEFEQAVEAGERLAESLEYLGHSLRRTRDFRGAVNSYKRLLSESLADADEILRVMYELAVTYEAAGNPRGAYKIYKRITDRKSDFRDGEALQRVSSLAQELGIN